MNLDPFTIGLISSVVPCILFYTKWKQERKKYQLKEQLYRKMIQKTVELQVEKAIEEQKILKKEENLGEQVEFNMIELLLRISNRRVRKICITGGPCAGKTTGLTFLQQRLQERGYAVFVVPEAATQIFLGGGMLDLDNYSKEGKTTFQMNLMNLQRRLEHTFTVLAMLCPSTKIPVLLCDRGLMDGKAYMESQQWYDMLAQYNLNEVEMRDLRYDAVIHMVTAADSTDCYSTLNNQARHETQEQALLMDQMTQMAWVQHPKYIKIDNHSIKSFAEKLNWLLFEVYRLLGQSIEPMPFGKKKVYLLSTTEKSTVEPAQIISQEQQSILLTTIYLIPKNSSTRLKLIQRVVDGQMLHYVQEKIYHQNQLIKVNSKIILKKEYAEFSKSADPSYQIIVRKRYTISYKGQYMVIDDYQDLDVKVSILKIQNSKDQQNTQLPPFIKIIRQLQDHEIKLFSCRHIAARKDIQKIISEPLFMQFRKLSVADDSIENKKQRDQELPEEFHLDGQHHQQQSPTKSQ